GRGDPPRPQAQQRHAARRHRGRSHRLRLRRCPAASGDRRLRYRHRGRGVAADLGRAGDGHRRVPRPRSDPHGPCGRGGGLVGMGGAAGVRGHGPGALWRRPRRPGAPARRARGRRPRRRPPRARAVAGRGPGGRPGRVSGGRRAGPALPSYAAPGDTELLGTGARTAVLPVSGAAAGAADDARSAEDEESEPAAPGEEDLAERTAVLPVQDSPPTQPIPAEQPTETLPRVTTAQEPVTEALPVTGAPTRALPVVPPQGGGPPVAGPAPAQPMPQQYAP